MLLPLFYKEFWVVDQRIHNPDSDSSHKTSESVDLTNLDSTDYGCEIRLLVHLSRRQRLTSLKMFSVAASVCGGYTIHLALYNDVKNCSSLKQLAIDGSLKVALIQPRLVGFCINLILSPTCRCPVK